jgi:ATP-dependent DNA helicase RecG
VLPELPSVASQQSSEKSSEKILKLLRDSPTMTAREIAQHIGISQRAIEKQIDKVKRDGNLRRVGPDKGGYWQVLGVT